MEAFEMPDLPGRCIGRDISRGEAAEAGLDAFIEQRHRQRVRDEGKRAVEVAWAESSRKLEARQRHEESRGRLAMCRHLEAPSTRGGRRSGDDRGMPSKAEKQPTKEGKHRE